MNLISIEPKEKTAQLLWTGFILAFFLIQAVIWAFAIVFTAGDKSHAVVAGYDERALDWDKEIAMRKASSELGWKATVLVDPAGDIHGVHAFTVRLNDHDDKPIDGATVELSAFHCAFAGAPQRLTLQEINAGVYDGDVSIRKNGLWQFDGQARKGDSVFLIHERQPLKAGK